MTVDSFAAESIMIFKRESLLRQNTRIQQTPYYFHIPVRIVSAYRIFIKVTACIFQYLRKVISLTQKVSQTDGTAACRARRDFERATDTAFILRWNNRIKDSLSFCDRCAVLRSLLDPSCFEVQKKIVHVITL